jgi:hypothetical protein
MIGLLLEFMLIMFVQGAMIVIPAAILAGLMLIIGRRAWAQIEARWPWLIVITAPEGWWD